MSDTNMGSNGQATVPPTEVKPKATRRRFTAEYKRQILAEAAACTKPGELGALLRRERLYSSHLSSWKAQQKRGELAGLSPRKRGPRAKAKDPSERRLRELEREVRKLRKRAERAEAMIEVQKKVAELYGTTLPTPDEDELDGRSS